MANSFQRARTTVILMGIASLLTGVVILLNPAGVALFLTALFGGVLAIAGAVTPAPATSRRSPTSSSASSSWSSARFSGSGPGCS